MFFVLSKIFDVLLSPFVWAMVLFALAVPWRSPRRSPARARRWRSRRLLGALGLLVLLAFSTDPVSNTLVHRLEHATTSTYRDDIVYDAVVLLGGVSDERVFAETGYPAYNDSVERLVATHRLLAEGHAKVAILSGASMHDVGPEAAEARVLARQLVAWGIDPSRLILEDKARNTRENAVYSQRVAAERGLEKVVMITSAFHMRRARECFEAVGWKVDTMSVDYRAYGRTASWASLPRAKTLGESEAALREFFGLYVYRARGYAKPPS